MSLLGKVTRLLRVKETTTRITTNLCVRLNHISNSYCEDLSIQNRNSQRLSSLNNYSPSSIQLSTFKNSMGNFIRSYSSVSGTVTEKATRTSANTIWPLYNIKVRTSRERWFEALDGLQFDVKYIDTCPKAYPLMPTVLCIHGAPGSHRDFSTIVDGLVAEGVRVIIPNLPGYGETEPVIPEDLEIFSHATDERTEFILNFIDSLGLPQIDILLGHSLGCSPLYLLGARCSSVIRSLVFLNPIPYEPYRAVKAQRFFKIFPWLWDRSFFRPFLLALLALNKKRLGFHKWTARQFAIATLTVSNLMFPMIQSSALEIQAKKIPFTYMWSRNDHMIESNLSQKTGELLGVRSTVECNQAGEMNPKSELAINNTEHYAQAVAFEKGSHMCHRKYPQVVVNAVTNQLNHINSECNSRLGTNFGRTS